MRKMALVAAAVLALGVAGGVVAQKLYARGSTPRRSPVREVVATPPDSNPVAPGFSDPFPGDPMPDLDPNTQRQGGSGRFPGDPFDDPFNLMRRFMQSNPLDPNAPAPPTPAPRHRTPGGPLPDVSDVAQFLPAMVDVACDKLQQCGVLDDATSGMCQMMGLALTDDETVERVHRGECHYDQASAKQCLEALGGMTCDSAADPGLLMGLTERVASCGRTLDCP